ncbi:hypothetical protein [Gluconacetobacter diazotrophicus]|uniref:hypothetical protein n=1 Tax=Gluconacetobacter diazotrophicus TaxID=33996 RepID=UPI0012FEE1A3|nr:hypothetical protein [Gluconacetobacter diazotrophicus]
MTGFFVVYLDRKPDVTADQIEEKMNKAIDWYKVDSKMWILYSSSSVEKLYARLSPLAKEGGNVFICELNIDNRQGWMSKSFWSWIKKER